MDIYLQQAKNAVCDGRVTEINLTKPLTTWLKHLLSNWKKIT